PGSIYPMLKRLEAQQLITGALQAEHELRPRKVYQLTKDGEMALTEWLKEMPKLSPFYQERELALWRFQFMEKWFSKEEILIWLQRYLENIIFHLTASGFYQQSIEALPKNEGGQSTFSLLTMQAHLIDTQAVRTWIELAIKRLKEINNEE
ncbi:MAG TPA: PadR family transcriptional regulator, partial [Aggregatilineales bacterium]|nr:PadR family transcriptional regulator [Aggregatilineales bacterium]